MPIHQQIIYSFPISNQYYSHINNEPTVLGGRVHTTISPPTHFINSCPSPTFYQSTDLGSLLMHGLLHPMVEIIVPILGTKSQGRKGLGHSMDIRTRARNDGDARPGTPA